MSNKKSMAMPMTLRNAAHVISTISAIYARYRKAPNVYAVQKAKKVGLPGQHKEFKVSSTS